MHPYRFILFIGGNHDGLNYPGSKASPERLEMPVDITDKETYNRSTLTVGHASITIYIHESLTPEQALNRLVEHYHEWCVNRPLDRRH
jgi:hypothetical protein